MEAPEAPIQSASALLIDVDRLDAHSFIMGPGCEPYITCRLGPQALRSAVGHYSSADDQIYFDSLLKFPFNYARDKTITFTLFDGTYEAGGYTVSLNLFEHQKPTRCVRVKLKGPSADQVGYLEMKFKLCLMELPKAISVKYMATGPRGFKSLTTEDSVSGWNQGTQNIHGVKLTLYRVDNVPKYFEDCMVTISLGDKSGSVNQLEMSDTLNRISLMIDKTWTIPYNGHRFIKLKFEKPEAEDVVVLAQGETDIQKFILNRPNVLIGSQPLRHTKIPGQLNKTSSIGIFYYRLEKCSQAFGAVEVQPGENTERPFSISA